MLKRGIFQITLLFVYILSVPLVSAQNDAPKNGEETSADSCGLFLIADYQNLRSTHVDHFLGFNVIIGKNLTPKLSLGIGIEETYGQHHDDNGLKLSEIRMIPVFLNVRYLFRENRTMVPFIELSTGMTFLHYYKKVKVPDGSPDITEVDGEFNYGQPFLVKASGLYTYLGSGVYLRISNHFTPFIGIGFKGNRMSLDRYDVNPRGLNFEFGCKI